MCFSIYFCAIYRSEDEEKFQEDPEDPDFVEEQEEDLAEGKSYLSLIILNPWFTNTSYRACFKYLYRMFILKHCLVNSYYCYCHSFDTCLTFPLQNPRRSPTTTILFVWMSFLDCLLLAMLYCWYSCNMTLTHYLYIQSFMESVIQLCCAIKKGKELGNNEHLPWGLGQVRIPQTMVCLSL